MTETTRAHREQSDCATDPPVAYRVAVSTDNTFGNGLLSTAEGSKYIAVCGQPQRVADSIGAGGRR